MIFLAATCGLISAALAMTAGPSAQGQQRKVFVAVTEPLIEFLTFDKGVPAGLPILIGLCVVGGVVGGFARTAPVAIRRPVTAGVLAVVLFGLLRVLPPWAVVLLAAAAGALVF